FVHEQLAVSDHRGIGAQVSAFAQAQHNTANQAGEVTGPSPTLSSGAADPAPTPPAWGLDPTQPGLPGKINGAAVENMLQVPTDRPGHPPTSQATSVISGLGAADAVTAARPTVTTDASDYAPGSTAEITASGFGVGDDIKFTTQVIDPKTSTVSPVVWDVV